VCPPLAQVVGDLGKQVQQIAAVLMPVLDVMAKRVVVAELERIRVHQAQLNQLAKRLGAVRGSACVLCAVGSSDGVYQGMALLIR